MQSLCLASLLVLISLQLLDLVVQPSAHVTEHILHAVHRLHSTGLAVLEKRSDLFQHFLISFPGEKYNRTLL